MRVFVTGAQGFIGAHICVALRAAGHDVIEGVRATSPPSSERPVACDMTRDIDSDVWLPRVSGCDAVVNCVGILRESGSATFARVHGDAPTALFRACVAAGVRRV